MTSGHTHETVWVALSGGVDSSVAASLLKEQGYRVVGCFMRCWSGPQGTEPCWVEDRRDAMRVAAHLGIPFMTLNFEAEYAADVFAYMREGYARGLTPNPDVRCNETIKFGAFFDRAISAGAQFIATGHYARRVKTSEGVALLKGIDTDKDQSYFLHRLTQRQLGSALFPVGHLTKKEVRQLAKERGMSTANKRSTRGICFVGKVPLRSVLAQGGGSPGTVVTVEGEHLGEVADMQSLTIGQRRGVGIGGGTPYFVVAKDMHRRVVTVATGDAPSLRGRACTVGEVQWIRSDQPAFPLRCEAKVRYRDHGVPCTVRKEGTRLCVELEREKRAITPGQYAVFYHGDECLGGGVIQKTAV